MPVVMGDGRRRLRGCGQKVDLHFKDTLQDINNKTRRVGWTEPRDKKGTSWTGRRLGGRVAFV